jgi:hypothetical protein
MKQARAFHRCERGAVFVQVGIAATVLVAFNVFVLDYGMMWESRRQAQNAADAGALAGAVARGYDDLADPPSSTGLAARISQQVARANLVWQQAPTPQVSFNCPPGFSGKCVQVDVYRNGEFGSTPLPTLFGPLLAVSNQGVRATATAVAGNGNATTCLKPWAIPDGWDDNWGSAVEFNHYFEEGPGAGTPRPIAERDEYTAPDVGPPGETRVNDHLSDRVIWDLNVDLLAGPPFAPIRRQLDGTSVTTGVLPLALGGSGAGIYQQRMVQCYGQPVALGQTLPIDTSVVATSAHQNGWEDAYDLDSGATLNISTWRIENSCAPTCAAVSPRLLAIVLYDPKRFQFGRATNNWIGAGCPSNSPCVTVSNIVGFFLHGLYESLHEHGHILKYPGITATGAPNYVDNASWLVTTNLVR